MIEDDSIRYTDYLQFTYLNVLYLYRYPVYADVVFIHGLLGGPFRTWRQNDLMNPERQSSSSKVTELRKNRSKKPSDTASSVTAESLNNDTETEMPYTVCWPKVGSKHYLLQFHKVLQV